MLVELHVHCSEISACGRSPYKDMIDTYKSLGYSVMVMTDHFARYNANDKKLLGYDNIYEYYDGIYKKAQEYGASVGMTVLKGYELRLDSNLNDYLVYGMPDEVASDYDRLFALDNRALSTLSKEKGFLVYQAHPFRNSMTVVRPDYLFGIEIYNGAQGHDSRNDIAREWAEKFSLHAISGSDAHITSAAGTSGVMTDRNIKTMEDLVLMLRENDYSIIRNPG